MDDFILRSMVLGYDDKWKNLNRKEPEPEEEFRFHWFHLYRESLSTQKWLFDNDFDELVIESLTDDDTRPRTTVFPDGILLNMRTVNISPEDDPHDMLSMRMFIQKNRIISTSLREIHIIDDIVEMVNGMEPPASRSEFLAYVIELITDRMESYIAENRDIIYDLEWHTVDQTDIQKQNAISDIRRSVITFSRYLSPQKDALIKLLHIKETLFDEDDRIVVEESINSTSRFIEELESINNRCHILKDDMGAMVAERMNRNMYLLSIVAAVFLPLSFLTGLLGVNLAGIPGAENHSSFIIFSVILGVIMAVQLVVLWISKRF